MRGGGDEDMNEESGEDVWEEEGRIYSGRDKERGERRRKGGRQVGKEGMEGKTRRKVCSSDSQRTSFRHPFSLSGNPALPLSISLPFPLSPSLCLRLSRDLSHLSGIRLAGLPLGPRVVGS